jgi:Lipid A 3-O-deacylase (PagL)
MILTHRNSFLLCVFALSFPFRVFCQDSTSSFWSTLSFTGAVHFGLYNAGNVKLQSLMDSRPFLGEFDISTQTTGKKFWQQAAGYPVLGIGIIYGNSGSREYIGNLAGIFPFFTIPLYKKNSFSFNCRFGIGVGWIQKPFNVETNYENLVIGSHLNACINFRFSAALRIQRQLYLDMGFAFTHLSNGSTKLPNLGLNIPSLTVGVRYNLNPALKMISRPAPLFEKKINYYLFVSGAVKEAYPLESASYLVGLVNFEMLKEFSYRGRFGGGFNITYDPSLATEIPNSPIYAFDQSKPKTEASIYGSYEYVLGRLSVPLQFGVYLYNNYPVSWVYQVIGFRFRLSNHFVAWAGLKTHFFKADFIQWGIGYKF